MTVSGNGAMGYIGKRRSPLRAVTQITSVTTGVTINAEEGVINCLTQTILTSATTVFTLTNSHIKVGCSVLLSVVDVVGDALVGTNGLPVVMTQVIADGSCKVVIFNADAASLVGVIVLGFKVIR